MTKLYIKIFLRMPLWLRDYLIRQRWICYPIKTIKMLCFISKLENKSNTKIYHNKVWRKTLFKLFKSNSYYEKFIKKFFTISLNMVSEKHCEGKIILICVVKNDLIRVKELIHHYRDIGISHFAFLDDQSNDGTREYLLKQDDVDLFESNETYTTEIRQAWINRIIDFYGFNRWYLVIDSDEFFVYKDCETRNINALVNMAEKLDINVIRSVLLEMYPKGDLLKIDNELCDNFINLFRFFDVNNYRFVSKYNFIYLTGGVRSRVFFTSKDKETSYLTKYPLINFKEGNILCNSHFCFPFSLNFKAPCTSALLHYKFLPNDILKYRARAKSENFASGSNEYKKYISFIDDNNELILYSNFSKEYIDSSSLDSLGLISDLKLL